MCSVLRQSIINETIYNVINVLYAFENSWKVQSTFYGSKVTHAKEFAATPGLSKAPEVKPQDAQRERRAGLSANVHISLPAWRNYEAT